MKTALLLLLAVSWSAATWTTGPPKVFSPNREYRYEYETQVLTGIPTLNSQYSGLKIKARAVMHISPDFYVTVKLTSIEVYHVKEASGIVPTTWVSPALLEPVPAEHSSELVESLVLPIKFRYTAGLVTKVYAQTTDPYWSVNIKRGIISLMNLDLNIENPVPVESSVSKSFMGVMNADYNTMSDKSVYKVIEPSTLGDCETIYNLVPIPSISELMVSKVIDTKRCSPKVMGEWGLFSGIMSGRNTSEMNKMIHPSVSVDYVLSGSRHEFLIKSVVLTGKYVFAPIVEDISSMDGYVIQKLIYVKDEPIDRPITFTSTPVPLKNGLHVYIPLQSLVKKEARSGMSAGEGRMERAKIEMVDSVLNTIVERTISKVEKEVPDMVSVVVSILRTLSKDDLMAVARKYCRNDVSGVDSLVSKKRTIVLDILSSLPHPDVPIILVRLVKEGHISGTYAAALINIASMVTVPSPIMVNELVEIAKDPEIVTQPIVQRAIVLGVGSMTSKLVHLHMKMGLSPMRTSGWIKNIVKEMKELLETSNPETRVAVVKAIGNAGVVEFIPDVERIIKDLSQPTFIRVAAVYALKKLTPVTPIVVRSILLPVYLDPTEPQDVRVAAFVIIMQTKPGFATIQMIGHSLNAEPSIQIASFVYSYLQNVARSSMPYLRPISIVVKRVLMTVRPINVAPVLNSKAVNLESFCPRTRFGVGVDVDKIQPTNSALPSAVIAKLHTFIFGKPLSVVEMGFEMEGMGEVIRKLVGTEGILSDIIMGREDIMKILDPLVVPDMGHVQTMINQILSETDIPVPKSSVLRLGAFLRIFGNELNFMSVGKEEIVEIIKAVKTSSYSGIISQLVSGYNVDIVKAVSLPNNAIVLPTPMGLPISLNISAVAAVTVKGQVKIEGISHATALWSNPSKVAIAVNLRPTTHIKVYQTLGIHHDIIQVGTTIERTIEADVPVSFKVEVDRTEEKVKVEIRVPKEVSPFVRVAMKPGVFTHFVPIRMSSYSVNMYDTHLPRIVPVSCESVFKSIPITKEYVVPVLLMKAKVSGVISYPLPSMVDYSQLLMSAQDMIISLEPSYGSPEAVKIEVHYGKRESAVRQSSEGWFGWLGTEGGETELASSDAFIPVTPNSVIPEPIKKQIFVDVVTVGGHNDASVQTKLTFIHDPSWMVHQINCQIIASQFITTSWKAKVETIVDISKMVKAVIEPARLSSIDAIATTDVSFGTNSFTENTILFKMIPSPVIIMDEPIMSMYESSIVSNVARPAKSINLKIELNFGRLSSHIKSRVVPSCKWIKAFIKSYLPSSELKSTSPGEKIEIVLNIFPRLHKINSIIATPSSTIKVYGIPVPKVWPFVQPIVPATLSTNNLPLFPEITTLAKSPEDIASAVYAVCQVTPTNVTTIANNTMPLPGISPSCEMVLAYDCSPQSLYTVISTPVTAAGARKIKIIIPQHIVEISRSVIHQGVVVSVDGTVTMVPVREPLVIRSSVNGRSVPVLEIVDTGRVHVVKAPQVGIVVVTDGITVDVKVSPLLMSTACGLCAYVPEVPIASPVASRIGASAVGAIVPPVQRFVVKSEQCDASGRMSFNTGSLCEMVSRNVKITRVSEGIPQVCFSVRPIPSCSGFCSPVSSVSETVGFHCMSANDFTARALANDVTERILSEMSNKVVHTYQPLMIPTQCVA